MRTDEILARMTQRTDKDGVLLSLYCRCGDGWKQRRGEAEAPPEAFLRAHGRCYEKALAPGAEHHVRVDFAGERAPVYTGYSTDIAGPSVIPYTGPTLTDIYAALIENTEVARELTAALKTVLSCVKLYEEGRLEVAAQPIPRPDLAAYAEQLRKGMAEREAASCPLCGVETEEGHAAGCPNDAARREAATPEAIADIFDVLSAGMDEAEAREKQRAARKQGRRPRFGEGL